MNHKSSMSGLSLDSEIQIQVKSLGTSLCILKKSGKLEAESVPHSAIQMPHKTFTGKIVNQIFPK